MRILVADDDPAAVRMLEAIITARTKHQVVTATNGTEAARIARTAPLPDMLILDWVMPGCSGLDLCRQARAESAGVQPYILLVTAKTAREDVVAGLAEGADDLLTKPIAPDLLVGHVRSAERRPTPGRHQAKAVVRALVEAQEHGDGELVVRGSGTYGRVMFHQGRVAWAQVAHDGSLVQELVNADADGETVRAALEECRVKRSRLSDTLVNWGLVDRARLRDSLKSWMSRKIAAIRQFSQPETLFLPVKRSYSEDLLFALGEVLDVDPTSTLVSLPPTTAEETASSPWSRAFLRGAPPSARLESAVMQCMNNDGVSGAALIDRSNGQCVGRTGTGLEPDLVWAHIQCLNVASDVEETIVTTPDRFHIVNTQTGRKNLFLYVVIDRNAVPLAMARLQLAQALQPAHASK